MGKIKIKETYLLLLILIGLVSLSIYSTYALFTASTSINDVVSFSTSLTTDSNILEYEMVTVVPGERKIIELNITNSYGSTLYYGAWYEMVKPTSINSDIEIGLYTDKNSTPGSGTISNGTSISLLVGITNTSSSNVIINVGVVGSLTSNLNLASTRTLLPSGWDGTILVTDEYLEAHKTTTTEKVNLEYTTPEMTEVILNPGTYKLEVWGAQGGSYDETYATGGKGGYSYGTLNLKGAKKIYVYVGGSGSSINASKSFNGGGNGTNHSGYHNNGTISSNSYSYSEYGGGASDIRIGTDSLYARVIVAGGGGGSEYKETEYSDGSSYTDKYKGGFGGGTLSGTIIDPRSIVKRDTDEYKATQISAGNGASFGYGLNCSSGPGGGGGWYGGGEGAGGSGWVYTEENYNTWFSGNSSDSSQWLLDSKYYLTNAATIAGNTSFTDFSGSTAKGHSGNGAVRITGEAYQYSIPRVLVLDDLKVQIGVTANLNSDIIIECAEGETDCFLEEISISDTSLLDAGEHTIYYTVNDGSGNKYKYPRKVIVNPVYENTTAEMIKLNLIPGTYKLEVWGAQGGSYNETYATGGKGGYSYGTLTLAETTETYIYVGGAGIASDVTTYTSQSGGGFNGGGNAGYRGGGGGGASDIRIGTDSLYARVIVAGGGGGAYSYSSTYKANGGSGGGTSGIVGSTYSTSYSAFAGGAATSTSGGSGGTGSSTNYNGSAGTFGIGGNTGYKYNSTSYYSNGAGGGDWYGGGAAGNYSSVSRARAAGGGGGSGYVYTSSTYSNYPSGCLLNSSYYLTDAATVAGNTSFTDFDGTTVTGHSGNGAARITKID